MESDKNDFREQILTYYRQSDWRKVLKLNEYSDNKNALKVLWVWPSEQNLIFLKNAFYNRDIRGVTSIGCGCGLLEWIIQQYTALPVVGIEINKHWWESKYSMPTFIPLRYVEDEIATECNPNFALLFCYFNNGPAFRDYVKNFRGAMIVIIGPEDGAGRHTDPQPFGVDFGESKWRQIGHQEVKNTQDFIAVYWRDEAT